MQGRFLPWAGCTISDLKLTCSSAQGECPPARAPGESAGAEPAEKLLNTSNKSSRIHAIIFFSRSLCIVRNWDALNISVQQKEPHEQLYLLENYKPSQAWSSEHLPPALSTLLSPSSCRHFTTKPGVRSEHRRRLFARWTPNWPPLTCATLLTLRTALCPDHTVWQKRLVGYLRDSSRTHARGSSCSPWVAPAQEMRLILTVLIQ